MFQLRNFFSGKFLGKSIQQFGKRKARSTISVKLPLKKKCMKQITRSKKKLGNEDIDHKIETNKLKKLKMIIEYLR